MFVPRPLLTPDLRRRKEHGNPVLVCSPSRAARPTADNGYDDSLPNRACTFQASVAYTVNGSAALGKIEGGTPQFIPFFVSSARRAGAGSLRGPCHRLSAMPGTGLPGSFRCAPERPGLWRRQGNTTCVAGHYPTRPPVKDVKKSGAAQSTPSISADATPGRCLLAKANRTRIESTTRPLTGPWRRLSSDLRSG